ncbi:hypothetical protein [Sphingobium sp. YR768]|uniref:hypothetical protein n=1 Tax=Sphingobium sp. YR768 TaxID=1884365 RepID=UPI000B85D847|nr:hypothetical protein [Sphingobium sp. YR768]
MTLTDQELLACAEYMIAVHGEEAYARAMALAAELANEDSPVAAKMWRDIGGRILTRRYN